MTLNDKSSPEDIKATFGISKVSSRKLGGLMKAGKIQARPVWYRDDLGLIDMIKLKEMSLEGTLAAFSYFLVEPKSEWKDWYESEKQI